MSRKSFLNTIDRIPELRSQMFDIVIPRLRKITRRFSEILKHIPHGIIKIDLNGKITEEFSSRCADYLGIVQLEGRSLGAILFADQEGLGQQWEQMLRSLTVEDGVSLSQTINQLPSEVIYPHPDGDNRIFDLFYYTVLDEHNQLIGLDIGFDDVTQKKHSQHELSSFRSFLANLEQLFILFNVESGKILQETITNSQLGQAHFPQWQQLKGKSLVETILYDQDPVKLDHLQRWLQMLQDPFCLQTMPHEELAQLAPTFSFETTVGQVTEFSLTINPDNSGSYTEALGHFEFIEGEQPALENTNHSMMELMEEVAASEMVYHHSLVDALNEMQVSLEVAQEQGRNSHALAKHQHEVAGLIHSIKGLAQSFKLKQIAEVSHTVEEVLLTVLRQGQAPSAFDQLDEAYQSLLALIVVSKSLCRPEIHQDLGQVRNHPAEIRIPFAQFQQLKQKLEHILNTRESFLDPPPQLELLESLRKDIGLLELTKLSTVYPRLQHIVEDTGKVLNKQVQLQIKAQPDFHLNVNVANGLHNCLIQLVKNAMNHGIETMKERQLLQKKEQAFIELNVETQEDELCISVRDNGVGLNFKKILNRAVELKLLSPAKVKQMLSEEDYDSIFQLIFISGFSTANSVSMISGRGVGMDMIKTEIEKLGGTVSLDSDQGKGTCVSLTLLLQNNQMISEHSHECIDAT